MIKLIKQFHNYLLFLIITIICLYSLVFNIPQNTKQEDLLHSGFELNNAMNHVSQMAKEIHFVGTQSKDKVKEYILGQLTSFGLKPSIQKTQISRGKRVSLVENIVAIKKGSNNDSKKLLLMSHYDSSLNTSYGASDAASGVSVILEGMNTFIKNNSQHQNDIIILITDAEEIGLLGAKAFAKKHSLAKDIGVVLNFEARGSSGRSNMLLETNHGNKKLLDSFKKAKVPYPSSSSLHYSIYKLLPNDMDMTILREDKDIQGMNFAFIDSHYNYHTERDNADNLSIDTLAHQASYLMPLLNYFSNADLNDLYTEKDQAFFQLPLIGTVDYSFGLTLPLSIVLLVLLIGLMFMQRNHMSLRNVAKFSLIFIAVLISVFAFSFVALNLHNYLSPQNAEIMQGFPYSGYVVINMLLLATLLICFLFYQKFKQFSVTEMMTAPILVWLLMSFGLAIYLKGAHILTICPVLALVSWYLYQFNVRNPFIHLLIAMPTFFVVFPIIWQLPVALGISTTTWACVLFALFLATFLPFVLDSRSARIKPLLLVLILIPFLVLSQMKSRVIESQPLPVSLSYYYDDTTKQSYWLSADKKINDWNRAYFESNQLSQEQINLLRSGRVYRFRQASKAKTIPINSSKAILISENSKTAERVVKLRLEPGREVIQTNIKAGADIQISKLVVNGETIDLGNKNNFSNSDTLAIIYSNNHESHEIELTTTSKQGELYIIEYSSDLLENKELNVKARNPNMIAKPYGYSDYIITRSKIII